MKIFTTLMTTVVAVLGLSACKSLPSYSQDYTQADQNIQGISLNDEQAHEIGTRFVTAFNTLGTPKFVNQASSLYADH